MQPIVIPVVQTWGTKQHLRYAITDTTGRYWTGSGWATRQRDALLYASHHDAAAAARRILWKQFQRRHTVYPPLRGTYFRVEDQHFLYTMGFIPYLQTYPGHYPPEPWAMVERHGGTAPKDLFREVLELTKMNVNNCSFADGLPITLSFADKVGEIMKHVPPDVPVEPGYKFYM